MVAPSHPTAKSSFETACTLTDDFDNQTSNGKQWHDMWVKLSVEYIAGIFTGAGAALFFLRLGAQSDMVSADFLTTSGCAFAGIALIIGGGVMKWRAQTGTPTDENS
ncbi:MAG: hypothetical protein HON53_02260 [Planctomycetaceae bacterium]|nr:hypothetical protein [Planctomycetaceae bacterium]